MLLRQGPKVLFTGGLDYHDNQLIWARLDKVQAQHPYMVLVHGGSPKGAVQIAFKPD